jgi:SAM-dependent methyltransferase
MFSASAELYDLIHSRSRDYASEAAQIAGLIRRDHPQAQRVLDVACGTAEHARLLTSQHGFHVDGLDLDAAFVRIARQKLPKASFYEADMITFELSERYDVIICLFSSIGYARTLENVRRTLERFRAHLADGGIVLLEPWFPPDVLDPGRISVKTIEAAEVTICRMGHVEIDGRLSRLRFEYLLGRAAGIEHASEVHELGLFTVEETLVCFREAGLDVDYYPKGPSGRGLYLARTT